VRTLIATILCGLIFVACNKKPSLETDKKTDTSLLKSEQPWTFGTRAYDHTEKILSFGPRPAGSTALNSVRAYLRAELAKHGWTTLEQPFTKETPKGEITFTNVIARYAPAGASKAWSTPPKGILSAHIDSKMLKNFLGADDAASAAGAILEIAEYLHTAHPKAAQGLELVFFDGEEAIGENINYQLPKDRSLPAIQDGLYGSHYYAKKVARSAASRAVPYSTLPKFGIVLDMIGHENLSIKIPIDTQKPLLESYKSARNTLNLQENFDIAEGSILDDHIPLIVHGIPTIDIIGDFSTNKWWHTTDDNLDIISKDSLSKSIRLTLLIIEDQL